MDKADKIFYALIAVVVLIGAVIAIRLIFTPEGHWHGQVTDKQVIPQGASYSDLIVSAVVDGHKQIFMARNSVVFVAITVGDTCDFTTYNGSQGVIIISAATCKGSAR